MASKYNDKEIIAAINIVHQILDIEEFSLEVNEYDSNIPDTQELRFNLVDNQGGNLGNIESESFDNLSSVIDRMDIYHTDYLYQAFEERQESNELIPPDDYDRKLLIFLASDYCTELLSSITVSTYTDYVKTGFGRNQDRLKENEGIDELSLLIDKDIAQKIIETQSAYVMVEYNDKVYLSYYGYGDNKYYEPIIENGAIVDDDLSKPVDPKEALLRDIKVPIQIYDENGNNKIFTTYDNYGELIKCELGQVVNDISDLGLDKFYLSQYELEYIGLEKEVEFFKDYEPTMESDEETKVVQAENLPEGWKWVHYDDASGHLKSPQGKDYFSYDWNTGEYQTTEDKNYDFFLNENYDTGGYSIGSFKEFKTFAENWIKNNILKSEQIKENTTLSEPIKEPEKGEPEMDI